MRLKIFTLSLFMLFAAVRVSAQERSFLSNYGVSINAGLTGVGATGSVALGKKFTARAGFGVVPYTYKYTMDEISVDLSEYGLGEYDVDQDVDLKAKLKVPAGHFLVDYNPFKNGFGAFHLTAGLYMGGNKLIHVKGSSDINGLIQRIEGELGFPIPDFDPSNIQVEVGDAKVGFNRDGSVNAYMKVNSIRPYFGIGWGNAIPKKRVGFRFDLGAMYHGKPEITSPNLEGSFDDIDDAEKINKILGKVKFWPQLSFQLTFRLLKDKK